MPENINSFRNALALEILQLEDDYIAFHGLHADLSGAKERLIAAYQLYKLAADNEGAVRLRAAYNPPMGAVEGD